LVKKILKISGWVLTVFAMVFLVGFVENKQSKQKCTGIEIELNKFEEGNFVIEHDIRAKINNMGHKIEGELLTDINVGEMEEKILNMPEIEKVEVYKSINGKLTVVAKQRRPIVRIINENGMSYYLDDKGRSMPWSNKFSSRVLIVNGVVNEPAVNVSVTRINFNDSLKQEMLTDDIYKLATYIDQSEFWRAQIVQAYVNNDSEFELIPRVGKHRIMLGGVENLDRKLKKLRAFYDKLVGKTNLNAYDTLNLKYTNQIICTKI
jgi:cell division protein FtsQ